MEWFVRWGIRLAAGWHVERRKAAGLRRSLATVVCLASLGALGTATWAFATNYVYDANGRLVVATNNAAESARYVYDTMGNLTAVERLGAGDVAIFAFNPVRGAPGAQIRVQGHGFSPNPADNALSFNGAPAVISAASGNELLATVPAAATTGPLAVTVAGVTAISYSHFEVNEALKSPVIDGVTPTVAAVGSEISVSGSSFNPVIGQATVRLGLRPIQPNVHTNNLVQFSLDEGVATGKVRISTPYGMAESLQDVVVVPEGIEPGEVGYVRRIAIGDSTNQFEQVGEGEYVALVFEGVEGDYLTAFFHGLTGRAYSRLHGTDNSWLSSDSATAAAPEISLPRLPSTGTYLLLIEPPAGLSDWSVEIRRDTSIEIDGDPLDLNGIRRPTRITFSATAGQRLGLGIDDLEIPNNSYVNIEVFRPNGAPAIGSDAVRCYNIRQNETPHGCGLNIVPDVTGTYSIVLTWNSGIEANFQVTLSSDHEGEIERNSAYQLSLSRRGENARLRFAGTKSETLALLVAKDQVLDPDYMGKAYYTVFAPNGALLASKETYSDAGGYEQTAVTINLPNLPITGEYEVFVDSEHGAALHAEVLLTEGIEEQIDIDGLSKVVEAQLPNQNIYLTFSGTQGQKLGLGVMENAPDPKSMHAAVYAPTGEVLALVEYSCPSCALNLTLPVTGVYSIVLDSVYDNHLISASVVLSTDILTSLEIGVLSDVAIGRYGQNARLSFAGIAGEDLSLEATSIAATPEGRNVYFSVYKPSGGLLSSTRTSTWYINMLGLNLANLPESGEYTILVDPDRGAKADAEVRIGSGVMDTIDVDGESKMIGPTAPGEHVFFTFDASAGQQLGLGIHDTSFSIGDTAFLAINRPSGMPFRDDSFNSHSTRGINLLAAPETGTYTVAIGPGDRSQAMSTRWTLSSELAGTLHKGSPTTVSLREGQDARFVFSAVRDESLKLSVTDQVTSPPGRSVHYHVFRPSGGTLRQQSITGSGTIDLGRITVAGEYSVHLDPLDGSALDAVLKLEDK